MISRLQTNSTTIGKTKGIDARSEFRSEFGVPSSCGGLGAFGARAVYGGHRRDWRATVSQLLLIVFFQFHFHFNVFLCYAANVSVISVQVDPLFKRRGSTKQRVKACYGHSSNRVVNKDRKNTLLTQKATIFNVHTSLPDCAKVPIIIV